MSTPLQNRQPPGRPTGGEYAPTVHAEPDVQLDRTEYRPAVIQVGSLEVSNYSYRKEPMPPWPASLPEPDPYFTFEDGSPRVVIQVEGLPEVAFWRDDNDDSCSSFYEGSVEWAGVDDEAIEEVEAYGDELCDRVNAHVYGITLEACQAPGVQAAILDDAMNRDPEPTSPLQRTLARAETALGGKPDGEEDLEIRLQDVLTDLRHYAAKHGVDFDELVETSARHHANEADDQGFALPDA